MGDVDLKPFCGREHLRPNLHQPFSRGDWTFATDGSVMVRVPRREDVPDDSRRPHVERVWRQYEPCPELSAVGPVTLLPALAAVQCDECEGRGRVHDCPGCQCVCDNCDGAGETIPISLVRVGALYIQRRYAALLLTLPGLRVSLPRDRQTKIVHFAFDGGLGLVQPFVVPPAGAFPIAGSFGDPPTPDGRREMPA